VTKRLPISVSQLCELVGVDPVQFRGIDAPKASVTADGGLTYHGPLHLLIEEPDHEHERHVSPAREGR
jgi:hypothetical protein